MIPVKPRPFFFALSAIVLLSACGGGSPSTGPSATPVPRPTAAPTARYQVTFQTSWSRDTHPTDFPANAHFSPLIGAIHSSGVHFWGPGALASDGIEAMAERGRTSPLDTEIEAAIAQGTARQVLRGAPVDVVPGSATLEFDVDREQPFVTLVTMIAPSPDWFVGVHDLNLIQGGDWVAESVAVLHPYDAGTDHGPTYASPDIDAQPRADIARLEGAPVTHQGSVAPFGTFVFRRLR
jgi:hypothetical protein